MGIWKGIYLGLQDVEEKKLQKDQLEAARQEKLADRLEQRQMALLQLAPKRASSNAQASKYAANLSWVKGRVGGGEAAEKFINQLNLDPSAAEEVQKLITAAEAKTGIRYSGDEFMNAVTILGGNIDNPNVKERFATTGDYVQAVLESDLSDFNNFAELYQEGVAAPTTKLAVDVNPNLYAATDTTRFEAQNKLFDDNILNTAKSEVSRLAKEDPVAAGELQAKIKLYGKDGGAAETEDLRKMFGPQVYQDLLASSSEYPILQSMKVNPYFAPYTQVQQPSVSLSSGVEVSGEDASILKGNPSEENKRYFDSLYGLGAADEVLGV